MTTKQHLIIGAIRVSAETVGGGGTITSNLRSEVTAKEADVLEAFLLALACEGIGFDERHCRALAATVDALNHHRD
jgi:hypothetical protein